MLGIGPIKNQAYVFAVKLLTPGDVTYRVSPTIATGDFKIETWDWSTSFAGFTEGSGSSANLATLPKVHATLGSTVLVALSAAEMNHDMVIVTAVDADGLNNNWSNNCWIIYPDVQKLVLEGKKTIEFVGSVAHLRTYGADGTTILLDKILKDVNGNDLTALTAGQLAQEQATTV